MRPEKRRRRERWQERKNRKNRIRSRRIWLTDLHARKTKVYQLFPDGARDIRPGLALEAPLAYLDEYNQLWVLQPGYTWDGASYPEKGIVGGFLQWFVGDRNMEAIQAASAFHDKMGPRIRVYKVTEEHRKILKQVFSTAHQWQMIREVLEEAESKVLHLSIWKSARIYTAMIRAWAGETLGSWRLRRQRIGLVIFQPWYRLTRDTVNETWQEYTNED